MWPEKNTAFIVIHGIGTHRPFVVMDDFTRGFWEMLNKEPPDPEIKWHHQLIRHQNWIENYISMTPDGLPSLEFYEYYWDSYMVREITSGELIKWLDQVSAGARQFYAENPQLVKQYRESGVNLFQDDDLKYLNYIRPIAANLWWLKWLGPLLKYLPYAGPVMKVVEPAISNWLRGFMQDLVIYTSSDVRSQNYAIRQQILNGAVEEIKLLLSEKDCQIVVVGHSLGSVIALDALNRIVLDMNVSGGLAPKLASRIGGLVTFGSPLDKIYFFFQEPTTKERYVQRQILAHYHGYKKTPPKDKEKVTITNPVEPLLDKSIWLNFYHQNDLVSGHLDAYNVDENIECHYEASFNTAHGGYWNYEKMYRDIAQRYFQSKS